MFSKCYPNSAGNANFPLDVESIIPTLSSEGTNMTIYYLLCMCIYVYVCVYLFVGSQTGGAQGLFLALHSGITLQGNI